MIIRKPGAALFVELVAGFVSMALGNQWGWETMYSALAQGLGAELVFAIFAYRRFGAIVAIVSCDRGLSTKGGPAGVANSVNAAVVNSVLLLFTVNVVLTQVFAILFPAKVV